MSETEEIWRGASPELVSLRTCDWLDVPCVVTGKEGSRRESCGGRWGNTGAVEDQSLWRAGSVVRNLQVGRECTYRCGSEIDANGTVSVGCECGEASIGLRKAGGIRTRDGNGADGKQLTTGIDDGEDLRRAGEAGDAAEGGAGWKNGNRGAGDRLRGIAGDGDATTTIGGRAGTARRAGNLGKVSCLRINLVGVNDRGRRELRGIEIRAHGIGDGASVCELN